MQTFTNQNTYMVQNYYLEPVIATLESGGLILYPTDTTWGIGCDATNAAAIDKVSRLKNQANAGPFVLLVASIEMLKHYVVEIHPRVETLLLFHARPLTVIYKDAKNLPPNACGADGSVAVRIPQDVLCKSLLEEFGKPIVATTANIGGMPIPKHFGEISSDVIMGVDYVVKYRTLDKEMGEPSVLARLSDDEELEFLRE